MFYTDVFGCVSGSLVTPPVRRGAPRLVVHFLTGSSVRPTSCLSSVMLSTGQEMTFLHLPSLILLLVPLMSTPVL